MRHSQAGWRIRTSIVAAAVAGVAIAAVHLAGSGSLAAGNRQSEARPVSSLALPLFFEQNQGQTDAHVKFLMRGSGYGLFLTADEAVLTLQRTAADGETQASNVIRMRLDGTSAASQVRGLDQLPGKTSYFIGNDRSKWHRGISQFARVEYQAVYPGIDLVYYGNQGQLEYDFHVAPGAEPSRIALSFEGASARLDTGDLVLATAGGNVRFHAPRVYQPGAAGAETPVQGSFRQLAGNKVGFAIGAYDRSRELVIDPLLSYSTYLGGTGTQSLVKVAVDTANAIYLAGSTNSADFPTVPPGNSSLKGNPNIFISKINPTLTPNSAELVYSIYLGGTGADSLAAVAVDTNFNVYVAGTTTSSDFPTNNGFQSAPQTGTHGFLSKLDPTGMDLLYSTYLSGGTTFGGANSTDSVTGLAVDVNENAYVTGVTNATTDQSNGFPANPNGYQLTSNSPGNNQFFASKIGTLNFSGPQSMLYSTYFGGGNPSPAQVIGGGIAIDASFNMYFTGTTNMQSVKGVNNEAAYPIFNASQSCLNQPGQTTCTGVNPGDTDAILVKINPNLVASPPVYSTYLGGSLSDFGTAVIVDSSSNAYVTGQTTSGDWICASPCVTGPYTFGNGGGVAGTTINAFIAKVGNETSPNTVFPLDYFTYLGGSGPDSGQALTVDTIGTIHLAGSTASPNLPITQDALQTYQGGGDAFVALIATSSTTTGNYITYLGGSQLDQGTGLALDPITNNVYVAGTTLSSPATACTPPVCTPPFVGFPMTTTAYQGALAGTQPNAFVTKIGNNSVIAVTVPTTSPSPNPVAAGTLAAFTFDVTNTGTDPATDVIFQAVVPTTGVATTPTAKVTSGGGNCGAVQGNLINCNIGGLAVNAMGTVEVDVTPAIPVTNPQISVSGSASANGGAFGGSVPQTDSIVDFSISCSPCSATINAGNLASFPLTLTPEPQYNATITMSDTITPAIVTATTPVFSNPTVTLSGSGQGSTTLSIQTVPRPVTTGSRFRRSSISYATWLPIGGLSLVGLGVAGGLRRRRWMAGAALGLLAVLLLLQPACSSSSPAATTNGGTAAGTYTITVTGSNGTGASHQIKLTLNVN